MNLAFKQYLERAYTKNSRTKTLLYRDTPVSLKNFYVRTDLVVRSSIRENTIIDESTNIATEIPSTPTE